MVEEAIRKIRADMEKEPNNAYMEIMGGYLICRCTDDITAAKIADKSKSLSGAWEIILECAKKAAKNKLAAMSSEEVFSNVDEYFGLTRDDRARESTARLVCTGENSATLPTPGGKVLDLTDFL